MKIMIVEHDVGQAEALAKVLHPFGSAITVVNDEKKAGRIISARKPDLVVLDYEMSKSTGLELLRSLRSESRGVPGILLLAKALSDIDVALATDDGVSDYVIKPYRVGELTTRVKLMSRRIRQILDSEVILQIGEYTVDHQHRTITLRGDLIDLTAKEFELAAYLFGNIGEVISRDLLLRKAWGADHKSASRTLDTHMYRLRHKLELIPENGMKLTSVYALGYRLEKAKKNSEKSS